VAQIAQGRVWSGLAAKEIGLVDEIGGLDAAIQYAAKQAKLGEVGNCKSILKFAHLNNASGATD